MDTDKKIGAARALRRRETWLERQLWRQLRNRQHADLKFRRQHPIGNYVVDFACPRAKLVIEIDGPHHKDRKFEDAFRTDRVRDNGYEVVRFETTDVVDDVSPLVEAIIFAVRERLASMHQ